MRPVPPSPDAASALAVPQARRCYGLLLFAAIAAITGVRLVWLAVQPADLYPDEAQYWFWAQHPAFGYYSKPPLIAWLIAATTALFGDSEFAIRLSAPLLHALACGFVYGIGGRLYDPRVGFWAALTYLTAPGVSLSAYVISTDAALLPCWAAALYAFVRARARGMRGAGGAPWWIAAGIAAGIGLLAKYAMVYWLISAFGFVLLVPGERRHLPWLLVAAAVAALLYAPNLWWNWSNGFVSYLHVRDNADLSRELLHPGAFLEFLGSQFAVAGPLPFAALLVILMRPRLLAERRALLLAAFALPCLMLMIILSWLSRAQPNWAAPAYVSASVLVVGWALAHGWRRWIAIAVALNIALATVAFGAADALAAAGVPVPPQYDPLRRLRGWRELGEEVSRLRAAYPGLTLLADDRELLAALIYYVRPHPFDAVEWNPIPGITDHFRLTNNIGDHRGEDFLAVTVHGLFDEMRPEFAELTPVATIRIDGGRDGGTSYTVSIARGYSGDGRRQRRR
jgi:4-amino-4-deoxy-L-arabinose transferase-like glycosyltransferase